MFDNNGYNNNNQNNYQYQQGYQNIENIGSNYFEMNNAGNYNNFDKEYDARQYQPNMRQTTQVQNNFQQQMPPINMQGFSGEYQQIRYGQNVQNVIFVQPKNFTDVQCAIKSLREQQIVIMNFSKVKNNIIQRILDYISGSVYALNGSMQRISEALFLLTPKDSKIKIPTEIVREQFGNK